MAKTVGIFIYDRFQLLDASGPITAFEIANEAVPGAYRLNVISVRGGRITSSSGLAVESTPVSDVERPDTVLVVGGSGGPKVEVCPDSMDYLRKCAAEVRHLCSVCSGAFLLAAAGVLEGRRVTTHWRLAEELQKRYPRLKVEVDRIYVRDGSIWTSGGVSAGIDLALALIANWTARDDWSDCIVS